jgi:anti-sigma factor RsiW
MRCKTAQRRVEAYLGGELTEKERARTEQHLASCAECTRALEHAWQLRGTLREKMTPPLPESFHARLMARAREHAGERRWSDRILRPFGWIPAMPVGLRAAAVAGVVVALGLGMLIGRDMWRVQELREAQPAQLAEDDPVRIYRVDYLTEAPGDSLAGAYVSLVSATGGE